MKKMSFARVKSLQKLAGYSEMQDLIDSGLAWKLEGSVGRSAMDCLRSGACMLPLQVHYDAYGNRIPSRHEIVPGSTGSFKLSQQFWEENEDLAWADLYEEEEEHA
jgi:hypothetical protein